MPDINSHPDQPRWRVWLAGSNARVFAIVLAAGLAGVWAISRLTRPPQDETRIAFGDARAQLASSMPRPSVDTALTIPPAEAPISGATRGEALEDTRTVGSAGASRRGAGAVVPPPTAERTSTGPDEPAPAGATLTAKTLGNDSTSGGGTGAASSALPLGANAYGSRESAASARGIRAAGPVASGSRRTALAGLTRSALGALGVRGQAFAGSRNSNFSATGASFGQNSVASSSATGGGELQGEGGSTGVVTPLAKIPDAHASRDIHDVTHNPPDHPSGDSSGGSGGSGGGSSDGSDSCYQKGTTECGAFTCAQGKTVDLSMKIDTKAGEAQKALQSVVDAVIASNAQAIKYEEDALAQARTRYRCTIPCQYPYPGHDDPNCRALNPYMEAAERQLAAAIRPALAAEKSALDGAKSCLARSGAPPDLADCRQKAVDAIAKQDAVVSLISAFKNHLDRLDVNNIVNQVHPRITCWKSSNHALGTKTVTVQEAITAQRDFRTRYSREVKDQQDAWTQEHGSEGDGGSWCARPGVSCRPLDVAEAQRQAEDHDHTVSAFASDIQDAAIVSAAAQTAADVREAAPLLASPDGNASRNIVDGTISLNQAAVAAAAETAEWASLKSRACSKPTRP